MNLPHVSTLYKLAPVKLLQPGFDNTATALLAEKFKNLSEIEKNVVLLFDEMTIRKEWRYNASLDLIDGVDHVGELRKNCFGKQICVFMARC